MLQIFLVFKIRDTLAKVTVPKFRAKEIFIFSDTLDINIP